MNYWKDSLQLNHPLYIFRRSTCTRRLQDTATLAAEHNGGNDGNWNGGAHVKFNISFQLEVLGLGGRSVSGSDYSYLTCSYYNSSLHFCELLGFGKERQMELQSPINFHSQQNKYWCDYILSKAISSRFPHRHPLAQKEACNFIVTRLKVNRFVTLLDLCQYLRGTITVKLFVRSVWMEWMGFPCMTFQVEYFCDP